MDGLDEVEGKESMEEELVVAIVLMEEMVESWVELGTVICSQPVMVVVTVTVSVQDVASVCPQKTTIAAAASRKCIDIFFPNQGLDMR